jgi:hypothetical protein
MLGSTNTSSGSVFYQLPIDRCAPLSILFFIHGMRNRFHSYEPHAYHLNKNIVEGSLYSTTVNIAGCHSAACQVGDAMMYVLSFS